MYENKQINALQINSNIVTSVGKWFDNGIGFPSFCCMFEATTVTVNKTMSENNKVIL